MQQYEMDRLLARHCAPTLLGIKAASLVALPDAQGVEPAPLIQALNEQLGRKGMVFRSLGHCPRTALMLAYRPELLEARLACPEAHRILAAYHYPVNDGLEAMLEHLSTRLTEEGEFPHEIGLFLDYPPADVRGFIRHHGADCKLCGYWKVYSDVDAARARFAFFDVCRNCLCGLVEQGNTISQLLNAA